MLKSRLFTKFKKALVNGFSLRPKLKIRVVEQAILRNSVTKYHILELLVLNLRVNIVFSEIDSSL